MKRGTFAEACKIILTTGLCLSASSCLKVMVALDAIVKPPTISLSLDTPVPSAYVNAASMAAYSVSGACSEEGRNVTLVSSPSGVSADFPCTSGAWGGSVDLSALADGPVTLMADHANANGVAATTASVIINKKESIPTVAITSPAGGTLVNNGNKSSFAVSGTCSEDGPIALGGPISATTNCNAGTWTLNLNLSGAADGALTISADQTDVAGNPAVTANVNVSKDTSLPGAFTVSGVQGGTDSTDDAFLMDGTTVTANWAASAGAASYDVVVYENDGTTVKCALQNVAAVTQTFGGCALSYQATYKVAAVAKNAAGNELAATNSPYSFYVNRTPVANNDSTMVGMDSSATTISVLANDTDADTDTLTVSAIDTTGTSGSVSIVSGGTGVSYTPAASFVGTDTFAYTASDGHNGTSTATVTVRVVSPFTWIGAVSSTWATSGNWCGTVTASACTGGAAPNNTQVAIFDDLCAVGHCDATIGAAINVKGIQLTANYTGTITQGAGNAITIGTSGYTQAAGTFVGNNAAIAISGPFALSAGSFKMPAATVTTTSHWSVTGAPTFDANGGTLRFGNGGSTINHTFVPGTVNYNHVLLSGWASRHDLGGGTAKVYGTLTLSDGFGGAYLSSGTMQAYGDVTASGAGISYGNGTIVLAGNVAGQTLGGSGHVPALTIQAGANPITVSGTLTTIQTWNYVSSGTFTATGTLNFGNGNNTIVGQSITPGTVTYNNVAFKGWGSTYNLNNGTINVAGTLTLYDGYGGAYLNSGTVNAYGDIAVSNKGISRGSATVVVAGNVAGQSIIGNGTGHVPKIRIDAGANPVTLSGTINTICDWTYVSSGAFTATGSTLNFGFATVTQTIVPGAVTYDNVSTSGHVSTQNLGGNLTVAGTLAVSDDWSGSFKMNGYSVDAGAMTISTATVTKGGGVLTVGGVVAGTGALFGGTVAP